MVSPSCKRYIVSSVGTGYPPEQTDDEALALAYSDTGEYYVVDIQTGTFYELGSWVPMQNLPPFHLENFS